jgi:hypothetical protein
MENYQEYLKRGKSQHGSRFDTSDLDPRFVPFFRTGQRIKVETCGTFLTGTVGVTTGWKPCFLLMRTKRSMGSPWTLGPADRLVAVQIGREYREDK